MLRINIGKQPIIIGSLSVSSSFLRHGLEYIGKDRDGDMYANKDAAQRNIFSSSGKSDMVDWRGMT
jgi:hypothetical protein